MRNIGIIIALALFSTPVLGGEMQDVVKDSLGFGKQMAQAPAALISGQISGVRVSGTDGGINSPLNINVRGVNTLRGDSQPLWIIDGVVVNPTLNENNNAFWQYGEKSYTSALNALSLINPNDIEKIEVLKDLSATSIYGSKGANGVIIITTRKAPVQGTRVNLVSNVGINAPDFKGEGIGTALSHNHYLSISDVRGKTNFSLSGFLSRNNGVVDGTGNLSGGIRSHLDVRPNRVVNLGMSTAVALGRMNSMSGASFYGTPSYSLALKGIGDASDTPGAWLSDYDDDANEKRVEGLAYLTLNFTPALSLKTMFGFDYQTMERYIWYGTKTVFGKENNGAAAVTGTSVFNYKASAVLGYNAQIASDHKLKAEMGVDASGEWTKYNTSNGIDFFSEFLRAKGLSLAASKPEHHKYNHNYNTFGAYLSGKYSFKDFLNLDLVARADNTERYDDSKLNLFGSAELAVDIKKVALTGLDAISTFQLKGGYGTAGREKYVPYGLYSNYLTGQYPSVGSGTEMYYEALNRLESREWNLGFDLGVFSDRVLLHAGYYDKSTNDRFSSYCFGEKGDGYWDRAPRKDDFEVESSIANRGFEFDIDATCLKTGTVTWTAFANASFNVNQLTDVCIKDCNGKAVGADLKVNNNTLGHPVSSFVGYQTDASGNIQDRIPDGRINELDKNLIGNPVPKFFGAFGTTVKVGRVTIDAVCNGAAGFDIMNLESEPVQLGGVDVITDKCLEKGDFLRLGRLSVKYDFAVERIKWIKSLSVNLSALNLFTLTSYSGWNPDVNCFGTSCQALGVDYGSLPFFRTVVLGINVNF